MRKLRQIRNIVYRYFVKLMNLKKIIEYRRKLCLNDSQLAYFVFTPDHYGIGDHAIAYATEKLFDKMRITYIQLTIKEIDELYRIKSLDILNGKRIYIYGAGNLGSLYQWYNHLIQSIIENNPNSKITVLPCSIYYGYSNEEIKLFENSCQFYNERKNVKLFFRESLSYNRVVGKYENIALTPDMVLSLFYVDDQHKKRDRVCLLCLRNDVEGILSDEQREGIKETVKKVYGDNYKSTDMVCDYMIPVNLREIEVLKKIEEFKCSQLVVTDRLHAMLFCAISATPCIVINSKSCKMYGCYKWIESLEYIRFINDPADLLKEIESMPKSFEPYNPKLLEANFHPLINDILN